MSKLVCYYIVRKKVCFIIIEKLLLFHILYRRLRKNIGCRENQEKYSHQHFFFSSLEMIVSLNITNIVMNEGLSKWKNIKYDLFYFVFYLNLD